MIGRRSHTKTRRRATRYALGAAGLAVLASVAAPNAALAQTITSAANQLFHVNDAATTISPITVADPAGNTIKFQRDIYITIPAGFNMTWDTSVLVATLTGNAAGRCDPNVTYLNGNQTVKILVNTTFAAGDQVVISGLRFANFSATSAANNLELALKSNLQLVATDSRSIQIGPYYEGSVAAASTSITSLPSNGGSSTVSFTVTNIGAVTDSYDLLTTKLPGTALSVVSITGTSITQGADPDSARRAPLVSAGAVTVTVTYRVGNAPEGTIDTLVLTARSVGNPAKVPSGRLIVTVIRPTITLAKSVSPSGSPGPGTQLTYTLTLTNSGSASASGVAIVDSVASVLDFKTGSASATLPAGVSAAIEYSNDGGLTWTYVPASGACSAPAGFDRCVNRIRWRLLSSLSSAAPNNQGTLQFVSRIR